MPARAHPDKSKMKLRKIGAPGITKMKIPKSKKLSLQRIQCLRHWMLPGAEKGHKYLKHNLPTTASPIGAHTLGEKDKQVSRRGNPMNTFRLISIHFGYMVNPGKEHPSMWDGECMPAVVYYSGPLGLVAQ